MKRLMTVFLASALAACATIPSSSEDGGAEVTKVEVESSKWPIPVISHSLRVWCRARWDQRCNYEAPAAITTAIRPGYVHCRTDGTVITANKDAASWWQLDGNRVRVFAAACGGGFVARYGSSIEVVWTTTMVQEGQEKNPLWMCRPETSAALPRHLACL
jgi:hypothetical protein